MRLLLLWRHLENCIAYTYFGMELYWKFCMIFKAMDQSDHVTELYIYSFIYDNFFKVLNHFRARKNRHISGIFFRAIKRSIKIL